MKKKYFSAKYEPVFHDGDFKTDPSEQKAAKINSAQDEISMVRDSVLNEPALTGDIGQYHLQGWLEAKRARCSVLGNLSYTFLAAIVAGPFAVLGAFMSGRGGWYGIGYGVAFAPVVEEFLKQSGIIYLLEKKPYRIFATWQFVFSAVVTALIFATIENLLYINFYIPKDKVLSWETFVFFRWTGCTAVHVCCSMIASLGLIRVWKRQLADGRAADLSRAFYYFAIAIAVHGLYNFGAMFFNGYFLIQPTGG
jgi:RsiW-degrading membrane proteinase PrsW (M82 family)